MKKIFAVMLTLVLALGMLAGCGKTAETPAAEMTDMEYVKDKGVLVVGITDFAPMDYKDADGNWIGFDADMATAFAESLGVKVQFIEIEWGSKILELDAKNIDCVWNGMTLTDEVMSAMDCSNAYCNNAQVVIVPAALADQYQDVALIFMDLNGLKKINDTYGHNAGDEVIIASARCIKNTFDSMGFSYRIGGDEFCAILPNPSGTEEEWFERMDQEITRYNNRSRYKISIARGVSYLRDENGDLKTVSDWKYEADQNMYVDKSGRKYI